MKYIITILSMFLTGAAIGQIELNVGDNFQNVVDSHPKGTTFIIKAGLHRMQTILARDGDSFIGELDANGNRLSVMRGSQILTGFTSANDGNGTYWTLNGQVGDNFTFDLGVCLDNRDCYRAEDIYIDCLPLIKVNSLAEMDQEDECFISGSNVYIRTNPANKLVEASVNKFAIHAEGAVADSGLNAASNLTVKNLIVEQYATPAQHGAIHSGLNNQTRIGERMGPNWLIENNEVRFNHGAGIFIYSGGLMKDNLIHHNGQIGMKASGSNVTIEGNQVYENGDWAGYKWSWEGGGSKFSHTTNIMISNNYVYGNYGPGLWTDIDNSGTKIENNICEFNLGAGIFHEISFDAMISCNTLTGNQYSLGTGMWYGGNIFISNSSDVEVFSNTINCTGVQRGNAIMLMCDDRFSSTTGEPYFTRKNKIYNNTINFLQEANLTGLIINTPGCSDYSENVFENNTYHSVNPDYGHFQWGGYTTSARGKLSYFNSIQQDIGSTIDANISNNNACNNVAPIKHTALCYQETSCIQASESCTSFESNLGFWTQDTNDDLDWLVDSNGTPSSSTGPSSATDGSRYIYIESSTNGIGFPSKTAVLQSECLTLNGFNNPALSFNVHMYGSSMGTLEVEVQDLNSGSSQTLFSLSGNQGNNWLAQTIDLRSYIGKDIIISFKALTGTSFRSDFALDEICLKDVNCTVDALCDDGNECTLNDVYQADCSCAGTLFEPIISNVTFESSPAGCQEIGIMNILFPVDLPFANFEISVDGGINYFNISSASGSVTFDRGPGSYDVYIRTKDGNCNTFMRTINIPRAPDTDNDGICDALDECPNDPINTCNIGCTIFNRENFESGWDFWQDGGTNAVLLNNASFANSGTSSVYIRGNTSTSNITTKTFNHSGDVELSFHLYAYSMETGDKFHVEVKNSSSSWTLVKTYTSGTDYDNFARENFELQIDDFNFSSNGQIRFRSETSSTADYVILDDIEISFCADNTCIDTDEDGVCAQDDPDDSDPCVPNSCAVVDCTRDSRIDQTCIYDISFDNTFGLWANPTEDDLNWVRRTGSTPSSNTGPSGAAHGTHYIYIESSSNGIGYPNKTAILESPCYKIPSGPGMYLNFRYHMYGSTMGSLELEITTDDITWSTLWSKTGDQGNQWYTQNIEVGNYSNQTVRFRFKAETGTSYRSDIALDLVQTRCLNNVTQVHTRELSNQANLNIFPNPAADHIQFIYESPTSSDGTFRIVNQLGEIIVQRKLNMLDKTVRIRQDISNLQNGVYHLIIDQSDIQTNKKFVVLH